MFFGVMSSIIPIFILVIFGLILLHMIRGVIQWGKNNASPVLTVEARLVSKRQNVSHTHHNQGNNAAPMTTSSTSYYVTFEVESGDRMEFSVSGREYGQLAEGDQGKLLSRGPDTRGSNGKGEPRRMGSKYDCFYTGLE